MIVAAQEALQLASEWALACENQGRWRFDGPPTTKGERTDEYFPHVRRPHKLPVVLSQEEVLTFFDHVPSLKYRAALMTCYGAGLRVSEAVALKVADIDSHRMLLRVEQGKGQKDRYAMLSPRLLEVLRRYWRAARPRHFLFPSWRPAQHLCTTSLQLACREAGRLARRPRRRRWRPWGSVRRNISRTWRATCIMQAPFTRWIQAAKGSQKAIPTNNSTWFRLEKLGPLTGIPS